MKNSQHGNMYAKIVYQMENVLTGTPRQETCSDRCPQIAEPSYSDNIDPMKSLQTLTS